MFGVSLLELMVIGCVCLVVFGPDKLPELARTVGKLTGQLRKASDTLRRDFYRELYPPLPDNPLELAKRELTAVREDLQGAFTGLSSRERWPTCESQAAAEKLGAAAQLDQAGLDQTGLDQAAPQAPTVPVAAIKPTTTEPTT